MGLCTGIRLGKFTVTPLSRGFEGKPVGYVVRAFRTGCALDILLEVGQFLGSVGTLSQAGLRVDPVGMEHDTELVWRERPGDRTGTGIPDRIKYVDTVISPEFGNGCLKALPIAPVILEVLKDPERVGCVLDARDQDFNGARDSRHFRDDDPAQVARRGCSRIRGSGFTGAWRTVQSCAGHRLKARPGIQSPVRIPCPRFSPPT